MPTPVSERCLPPTSATEKKAEEVHRDDRSSPQITAAQNACSLLLVLLSQLALSG